jgi:DNA-binding LytR/AlgR family response regulator/signal transduction histidine kinase
MERLRSVGAVLGWWGLLIAILVALSSLSQLMRDRPLTPMDVLRGELLIYGPWALLTPFILALVRRLPLSSPGLGRALLAHSGMGVLCALLHSAIGAALRPGPAGVDFLTRYLRVASRMTVAHLLFYGTIVGVLYAITFRQALRERSLHASRLEAQLAQAQLEVLRMQLQPHFLFNTLHTISALMSRDVPAARRTLARLCELLRSSLEEGGGQQVALQDELKLLECYVDIQRTRFQERLQVELAVAPETARARVPRLVLQPLVENAVRHGLAPRPRGGRVVVRACREDSVLVLEVEDDGVGLPPGIEAPAREGVGLSNHARAPPAAVRGASVPHLRAHGGPGGAGAHPAALQPGRGSEGRVRAQGRRSIRTLLVDDEPLARGLLRDMLAAHPDFEVVGECGDGDGAVRRLVQGGVDLVFLDVQMPGLDGFGVVQHVGEERMPMTVFATAYHQYAIRAFEEAALDYLLKPFDEERLARTLQRVSARRPAAPSDSPGPRMLALLEALSRREQYAARLVVKEEGRAFFLPVEEVDWVEADGKHVKVHARERLQELLGKRL